MVFGRRRNVLHLRNGQRITIVAEGRDAKVVASRPSFGQMVVKRFKRAGRTVAVAGIITAGTLMTTNRVLDSFMRSGLMWPTRYIPAKKLVAPSVRQSAAAPQSPAVRKAVEPNESNRPVGGRVVDPNEVRRVREPNAPAAIAGPTVIRILRQYASPESDFLVFKQQQATLFGIKLTSGIRGYKPSPLLMQEIKRVISEKCVKRGINDKKILVYSIIEHESWFNPNAKGNEDRGLGQLNPIQIEQLRQLGFKITNPYDIEQNVEGVARTIEWLDGHLKINNSRAAFTSLSKEQRLKLVITAYNSGIGTVNRFGLGSFSQYTDTVWGIYQKKT